MEVILQQSPGGLLFGRPPIIFADDVQDGTSGLPEHWNYRKEFPSGSDSRTVIRTSIRSTS